MDALKECRKILIANIFGVGDVLFTTPLIRNIKEQRPDAVIGYLGNRRTEELLRCHPLIDKIFVYERDEFEMTLRQSKWLWLRKVRDLTGNIRRENYDAALNLSLNPNLTFLMWAAGIKRRIGFAYKNRGAFLTTRIPLKGYESKHVVEYYLDALSRLGCEPGHRPLEMFVPSDDVRWARDYLEGRGLFTGGGGVAIVPGGGASWGRDAGYKRWPAECYAQLTDKIIEKFKLAVILLGSPRERELCERVAGLASYPVCAELAGKTTLMRFAALLKECRLAVVNDGGPLHVAVAAGTKTVSLFGPVDEKVYGPYPRDGHRVITGGVACRPCYRRFRMPGCQHHLCLHTIDPDDVLLAVEEMLEQALIHNQ